jgi:dimethylglycine dehydrogenase
MQTHARVVIIGGGIAGCSLLYHLARGGWTDIVLLEKHELTAGSTWHAAGNTPHFETSLNMVRIQKYSTELYERLEAETGQPTGFHKCGSLRLGENQDRLDQFRHLEAQAKHLDMPFEVIGPDEIKSLLPFMGLDGVIAGAHTPADGYTDPSSTTAALAKGARDRGAVIHRHTPCNGMRREGGEWVVETPKGEIRCEHVVNAGGTWARELGRMVGLALPIVSCEHQYLVTESVPEVEALDFEFPLLRDPMASYYLRQEGKGMLLGPYETPCHVWGVDGIPPDFADDLLPPDLDRIEYIVEQAIARIPALGRVGIKRTVNGPIPHTPDGNPLIGPAADLPNYWCINGFSVGIAQSGGAGHYLAGWMIEGAPEIDMFEFDPRRYGPHAGLEYTVARSIEVYEKMYAIGFPHEERSAGRPLKTTPLYHRLKDHGAVFEARYGWERAAWFAPEGVEPKDEPSFRRANWFPHVGAECRAVRDHAGILDLSAFAKFEISGPDATTYLSRLCANGPPKSIGRVRLTQMLNTKGKVNGEATILHLPDAGNGDPRYYMVTAAVAETHDRDWLDKHVAKDGRSFDVTIETQSEAIGVLVLAGPNSRDILAAVTRADVSNAAFPWLSAREIEIAMAPVRAIRMTYVGELGWELHMPMPYLAAVYEALWAAGQAHGLVNFGTRAMDSMRLEKGYRAWGSELNAELTPLEAGLDRLTRPAEAGYIGAEALAQAKPDWTFAILTVDADDADALPNSPIWSCDELVGIVTSGGYGHRVEKSIAFAYLKAGIAEVKDEVEVMIFGERRKGTITNQLLYDSMNTNLTQ